MIISEINDKFKEVKDEDELVNTAKKEPNARFHRLHFRRDTRMFEDEVLTASEVIDEHEAGITLIYTGVDIEEVKEK